MSKARTSAAFAAALCALVGGFEGYRQTAYTDVVGVPTICYGETKNVRLGMKATRAECDAMLLRSLIEYEDGMLRCLRRPLPEDVQRAFVSFTYNVGIKAFCGSTVARRANAGDLAGACDALLAWDKAGGITWPGLTKRRQAERAICKAGLS